MHVCMHQSRRGRGGGTPKAGGPFKNGRSHMAFWRGERRKGGCWSQIKFLGWFHQTIFYFLSSWYLDNPLGSCNIQFPFIYCAIFRFQDLCWMRIPMVHVFGWLVEFVRFRWLAGFLMSYRFIMRVYTHKHIINTHTQILYTYLRRIYTHSHQTHTNTMYIYEYMYVYTCTCAWGVYTPTRQILECTHTSYTHAHT